MSRFGFQNLLTGFFSGASGRTFSVRCGNINTEAALSESFQVNKTSEFFLAFDQDSGVLLNVPTFADRHSTEFEFATIPDSEKVR